MPDIACSSPCSANAAISLPVVGVEVFANGVGGGAPANALLDEDGEPLLDENGQYIIEEDE